MHTHTHTHTHTLRLTSRHRDKRHTHTRTHKCFTKEFTVHAPFRWSAAVRRPLYLFYHPPAPGRQTDSQSDSQSDSTLQPGGLVHLKPNPSAVLVVGLPGSGVDGAHANPLTSGPCGGPLWGAPVWTWVGEAAPAHRTPPAAAETLSGGRAPHREALPLTVRAPSALWFTNCCINEYRGQHQ